MSTKLELLKETNMSTTDEKHITPWVSNPYIQAATSDNTRKAYRSDIRHFEQWGGKLPTNPETIADYLQTYASSLNPRTLSRRLTALKHWHHYQGFTDPTQHPAIQKTMIGIARVHGKPKVKALALLPEDLLRIVTLLNSQTTLAASRDNALLQIGYFGAFRRSELISIHIEHIQWKEQGVDILLPHSKTDQSHEGQFSAVPYGKDILCPVTALKIWLQKSNINQGPIFREIKKGEQLNEKSLSPLSVNYILKKRARECGLTYADKLSGHSLRRGLATSASLANANLSAIMRQGRWKQVNTVMEYVEAADRFSENVASSILDKVRFK